MTIAPNGRLNVKILWEMGGAQRVLEGILERTKGLDQCLNLTT